MTSSLYPPALDFVNRPLAGSDGFNFKSMASEVSIDDAQGIVECFVAAIGNKDSVGDIVAPGAFDGSLRRRRPRVVWGHDWNSPIGKVLDITEVGPGDPRLPAKMRQAGVGGLFAKVQFNLRSDRGREAFESVRFFGNDQEWSIGYKTLDAVYDNERKANILREVELYEVSPVLHGANQLTGTISIKSETGAGLGEDEFSDYSDYLGEKSEQPLRDPEGGLTAAGRAHFRRTEGANLKPGVKGPADTPEKMRRKGSFLTRFFTNPSGPMKDEKGEPTRLALSARAWGEPVPQNAQDAAALAAKGRRLLERYRTAKTKGYPENQLLGDDEYEEFKNRYAGDDDAIPAMNPALGRDGNLARALSTRFGGTVRLREADVNQVIFDHTDDDDEKHTWRVSYHYEDGLFMFGDPVRVKPQVVYLEDEDEDDEEEDDYPYHRGIEAPSMQRMMHGGGHQCSCGGKSAEGELDEKAGRVLSGRNLQRVRDALALLESVVRDAGQAIEMKQHAVVDVKTEHAPDLAATLEPIALRYGATISYSEYDGIVRIETPYEFHNNMIDDAQIAANNAGVEASWNTLEIDLPQTSDKVSA